MDKSAIKNFSIEARKVLMRSAETEAGFYGVTRNACKNPIQKGNDFEVYETLAGTENRIYGADIKKRANLVEAVETLGFDQVIEETAYTWFNRIIAIRFMEVNGYLPTRVRVLSSETGSNTPDIVTQSLDVDLNMTPEELEKVQKAKDENRYDDAFRMLFVKQCNELNAILPGLFEETDDYMELLLKLSYTSDGVVRMLVDTVAEDNFNVETEGQVEIIGWMYQYYNTELKDDTFSNLKNKSIKISKDRIPAATQVFTPDWIVRYMVENSIGRVWIEHLKAIDPTLNEKAKAEDYGWKYYLPEAVQEEDVQQRLVEIGKCYLDLEVKDINCIDPCMGSGHILVYMFDILMDIYKSEGFNERDATYSILENNIRGLDIDTRAYQLSYFALMMKARSYNRTYFRGKQEKDGERVFVEPLVFEMEESNDINREQIKYLGANLSGFEKNNAINQINGLLDSLVDAKEYGSIISIENYDWDLLRRFVSTDNTEGQISFDTVGIENTKKKLTKLIKLGVIISGQYMTVVTNPPYRAIGDCDEKLVAYANEIYPDSKNDLSTIFMERCKAFTVKNGFYSMINIPVWMYLIGYEKLRIKIMKNVSFVNLLHLGRGIFGSDFGTTAFVVKNASFLEYKASYKKLYKKQGAVDSIENKERLFFVTDENYTASFNNFLGVPGYPIIYRINNQIENLYKDAVLLGDLVQPKQGLATGGTDKFLRGWYEVDYNKICFDAIDREQALESKKKWFPINKGGDYCKWYGNRENIVNWENDGYEIRHNFDEKGKLKSRPQNMDFYFRESISCSAITAAIVSYRYYPAGAIFDVNFRSIFVDDGIKYKLIAILNSKIMQIFCELLNPTMALNAYDINRFPLVFEFDGAEEVEQLAKQCIQISKEIWDEKERSFEFKSNNCLKYRKIGKLEEIFSIVVNEKLKKQEQLIIYEKQIEQLLAKAYGFTYQDEEINVAYITKRDVVEELLSYFIGCAMGRYSIYQEGIWTNMRNLNSNETFKPVSDGIIMFSDDEFVKNDMVSLLEQFLTEIYGVQYLEENLNSIASILYENTNENAKINIRKYFINEFYKKHCSEFTLPSAGKRPIYWMFDSGKQNGFKCLMYMHRYCKDSLNLIKSEYFNKAEDAVQNALKNTDYIIQTTESAIEKAKATKDRDKYVKQLNEMRIYYQALSHLSLQKIEINLDDGVKNNYQLFQGIEVIADGGKKQKVDLLAKI